MDLKTDSSGRGRLLIDPGQCESGSTLTTSVDVGRIQEVLWKGPRSKWLITSEAAHFSVYFVAVTLFLVVIPRAILDVLM